jgi:hypothetical protein
MSESGVTMNKVHTLTRNFTSQFAIIHMVHFRLLRRGILHLQRLDRHAACPMWRASAGREYTADLGGSSVGGLSGGLPEHHPLR